MEPVRSVLYLDFDNVFSGLSKLDPRLAMRYAEEPHIWLRRLATSVRSGPSRRWLVLRCYINPAGWIPHPLNEGNRLYFSRFRPYFTDAGFEVVDCPRLSHTKNGADIRLVIDAVEALRADVRYEEFVIASGDSDMTPLIVRLRASDRRVTLLSPADSAVVLGAVADQLIGGEELLELIDTAYDDMDATMDPEEGSDADALVRLPSEGLDPVLNESDGKDKFVELVNERYNEALEPINLAALAHELSAKLGPIATGTGWFGHGGFARAIQALNLPGVRMSQHLLWDAARHTPQLSDDSMPLGVELPDPVARVTRALKLPGLPQESWGAIYHALAAFVSAYEFSLSEATRWCRDRLLENDRRVSRQAVGVVARGAAYGGCPLYRQPPPGAEEIAGAFVGNVLDRAVAADVDLLTDEMRVVRDWLIVT
jgi:uncharacterized LabA/DUF88 family protein